MQQNQHSESIVITNENLAKAWQEKCNEMVKEHNFLKGHLAEVIVTFNDAVIHLLAYTVAYDFLKSKRIKLLNYFKDLYKNEAVNVLIEERKYEVEEDGQKVLSSREIFEEMSRKNPLLKQLKENLGMDFDL